MFKCCHFTFAGWYIIQFSADEELSDPVPGNQVEDEETGETGTERHFHSGDRCSAPWLDGKSYDGSVVFESGE